MAESTDLSYLIGRSADGRYRIIVRKILYNDEGYPLVATTFSEPSFSTAAAARRHARAALPQLGPAPARRSG